MAGRPRWLVILGLTLCPLCAAVAGTAGVAAANHGSPTKTKQAPRADRPADKRVALRHLRRARSLLRGSGVRTGRELTPVLSKLALGLPALTGADRRLAKRVLARPTEGFLDSGEHGYAVPEAPPRCTEHFCVHYVATTVDAPSASDANGNGIPDYVESMGGVLEGVWRSTIAEMGWRAPLSDRFASEDGGDGRVDVYLAQIGDEGLYGYAAPDDQTTFNNTVYGYLVLDNDYSPGEFRYPDPSSPRAVTIAHEFNHLVQFAYDAAQDLWMQEGTSTWFEERLFPAVDDYLQYVGPWAANPGVPITAPVAQKVYGNAVWSTWLANRMTPAVLERAWASSRSTYPQDFAALAYDEGIKASGGQGIEEEFGRFTAEVAEWRINTVFPEGARYPDVARAGVLPVDGPEVIPELDHGSFALFDVPHTGRDLLTLEAEFPEDTTGSIALVASLPGGFWRVEQKMLPVGFSDHVTFAGAASAVRMTAVIANADFETEGWSTTLGDWVYAKDGQPVTARVLGRAPAPQVFLLSKDRQKRSSVIKSGLLVSAYADDEVPVKLSVQVEMKSRDLRTSTVVGRGSFALRPTSKKYSFRVKLSKAARRALARRGSTNLTVKGKFIEPTGTATQRDSETIKAVR